ncbi:MAG TPA: hypothetical protein VG894_09405 [Bauldia sp.]|nr:hypothetical protein [Bauldia sp.]
MARQTFESPAFSGEEEKPIDPAFLSVQRKLRRLMFIGGGTLGVGLLAVLIALVYRITTMDATPAPAPSAAGGAVPTLSLSALGLPADAKLVSTALDGNRLALTYQTSEGTETVVVDTRSNAVILRLKAGP